MRKVALVATVAMSYYVVAVLERFAPRWLLKWYWKLANPLFAVAAGVVPGFVILETIGRRTGNPHQVPVGGRFDDGSVWIVVGRASEADYVRNLKANPRVRVRVGGSWRRGTAQVLLDDNTRHRALWINPLNGIFVRLASSDLLTIRIDLD